MKDKAEGFSKAELDELLPAFDLAFLLFEEILVNFQQIGILLFFQICQDPVSFLTTLQQGLQGFVKIRAG